MALGDEGTPVKHGGSIQYGCVWYEIQGQAGSSPLPTSTPTTPPTTTTTAAASTATGAITCYDDTFGKQF